MGDRVRRDRKHQQTFPIPYSLFPTPSQKPFFFDAFQVFGGTELAVELVGGGVVVLGAIATEYTTGRTAEGGQEFGALTPRIPFPESLDPSRGRRDVRVKVRDIDEVTFGTEDVDLSAVEQLVSKDQLRAIAAAMVYVRHHYMDGQQTLTQILDRVMTDIAEKGLDGIAQFPQGDLALFQRFELAVAINRVRTLEMK